MVLFIPPHQRIPDDHYNYVTKMIIIKCVSDIHAHSKVTKLLYTQRRMFI